MLSNRPEEFLEELLKTELGVPEDFLEKALQEDKNPVEFLVEKGLLTLSETRRGNKGRIVKALRDALEWPDPDFYFQELEVNCELPPVDLIEALRQAITSMKDRGFFKRLFPLGAKLITSAAPGNPTPEEKRLLREFSEGKNVWDVVRESPWGEFPTLKLISVLHILGFLKPYTEEPLEEIEEYHKTSELFPQEENPFGVKILLIGLLLALATGAGIFLYTKLKGSANSPGEMKRVEVKKTAGERKEKKKPPSVNQVEKRRPGTRKETPLPLQSPWRYVRASQLHKAALLWKNWAKSTRGYTLLMQLNCVEEYALANLKRGGKRYFVVPFHYKGKLCYRVCYGVFRSREEAAKAARGKGIPYPLSKL